MIQDSSEKDINSDGDKPDKDDHGLSAASELKPKVLLAIDKLREKKKRQDVSTITDFLQKNRNMYQWSDLGCNNEFIK